MRHRKANKRMGRDNTNRSAMLSALVCGLIDQKRITTTLPKAKLARQAAEKMVTLARKGTLAARRQAIAALQEPQSVRELFDTIIPGTKDRKGGYTRIVKLGHRIGDGAELALLEWVDVARPVKVEPEPATKGGKSKA